MSEYKAPPPVDFSLHLENRNKVIKSFENIDVSNSAIVLQGGSLGARYCTDVDELFNQEGYFWYCFPINEPDFYGVIDLVKKESILFIPRLDESYELWCGPRKSPNFYKEKFLVDHVHFVDELENILKQRGITKLHVLYGQNSDSRQFSAPASFKGIDNFTVIKDKLFPKIQNCRVFKSEKEIELMRYSSLIASNAHTNLMKICKPGMYEYQLESTFHHECYMHGCRYQAYGTIVASGSNGAVLHYGHSAAPNDCILKDGTLVVIDCGPEYHHYASDITRTFPINGKFTEDQKKIYNAVLDANCSVIEAMKPGVKWSDMHQLALQKITEHLLKHGLLRGSIDDLMKNHVGAIFFPHGLGHLMGIDVHDVGGYPEGVERIDRPSFRSLRANITLKPGMVFTVEPGCYFIDAFLDKAIADPKMKDFLNVAEINKFRGFGGVRIEDDILVTENGHENFTKTPKTVEDIEKVMA